jgi:hypothetical protein
MRYLFLSLLIFTASTGYAGEKRALKLLEKGKYSKLVEYLDKSIQKDSLNPGAFYVYSLLFNEPAYYDRDLDTAYYFILISQEMIKHVDERGLKKLERAGINDSAISVQKQKLDLQGYERAKDRHAIDDYNAYIQDFSTSQYRDLAIEDRNALAFEIAEKENTYQSYYSYMQDYPDSHQFRKAKENYDKLLFEDQIRDGTLRKYTDFIDKYPESPFLPMAIENIYNLSTCGNSEGSLTQFIKRFPDSGLVPDAIDRLFHNFYAEGKRDFTYDYSYLPLTDSIKRADWFHDAVLIPVFEQDKYGFITTEGEMLISYLYDDLDPGYLCGNIRKDFLKVKKDNSPLIISKTGNIISSQSFYDIEDIGYGLLKISDQVKSGLLFKTGKQILPIEFDEIERLGDRFLKVRQNRGWRLYSINGLLLSEDYFLEINKEGMFMALKKDSRWAISTDELITSSFINGTVTLDFSYDDYELIETRQILCMTGDRETILDHELKEKIPLELQNIYTLQEGWLVRKDALYHIFDDAFVQISGSGFEKVKYRGKWIAGKSGNKWILYYNYAPFPDVFAYDSLNILSDHYVLGYLEDKQYLIFSNLTRQELKDSESMRILKFQSTDKMEGRPVELLRIDYSRSKASVFNQQGKEIINGIYDDIQVIGPEYLIIQKGGKTGLSDTSGQILLKPQYDAIANYHNGFVSMLNQKKFGLFNMHLDLLVTPRYDRLINAYNKNFLLVHEKDGYGLIDLNRVKVTETDFEEILYWNDTSMLARRDGFWHIFDLKNGVFLLKDILRFEFLKNEAEKIIIYNKDDHFGVAGNEKGILINHTFNDIVNLGTTDDPVFFAEKYIPEAEFYVVIYYDRSGRILRKQVFDEKEYDKIYCN